jgi:hypothetical protein
MAYKLVKTSENAAYKVAIGATAEDAAKDGLGIVELNFTTNPPSPVYGKYDNAPDDGPIPITVAKAADTEVIGGGSVGSAPAPTGVGDKGSIVNLNDPFVHSDENIHADGAPAPVRDLEAERAAATEVAEQSIEDATKAKPSKSK